MANLIDTELLEQFGDEFKEELMGGVELTTDGGYSSYLSTGTIIDGNKAYSAPKISGTALLPLFNKTTSFYLYLKKKHKYGGTVQDGLTLLITGMFYILKF